MIFTDIDVEQLILISGTFSALCFVYKFSLFQFIKVDMFIEMKYVLSIYYLEFAHWEKEWLDLAQ